jgi:chloride channel protein, CIC family
MDRTKTLNIWYLSLLKWRESKIKTSRFILILSLIVGVFTALAAFVLKNAIHFIQNLLTTDFSINHENYLYLAYPIIGIFITALFVRYVVKDDISHGVTRILYAISKRKSILKPHNNWTSIVASSVTIGFGGSVGAEAPIVLTGSSIGSNLGKFFKMDQKTLMLLVGCGAAGAIGGIFKCPIAGVVFTLEVLMLDMTLKSVVPLLISSVTATSISYFLMGNTVMFAADSYEPFLLERIPYYILLGIVCGLVSLYFTRTMNKMEGFFQRLKSMYTKLFFGGVILSLLIFVFPPLYGEGYESISALLNNQPNTLFEGSLFYTLKENMIWVVMYMGFIILLKVFATSATNGAGGVGGIFAPSLFIGSITGFAFALVVGMFGEALPGQNFALVGMAGVISGVMHAPLTGIFLIAELSGGYGLFIPIMIVSTVSFLTIIGFEPHSIYAMRLAKKGELRTHHKDKAVLNMLNMSHLVETDLQKVHPDATLGDLVKVIATSKRNLFPVVDKEGVFLGVVLLEEIRNIMFRSELYQRFTVSDLMIAPPSRIFVGEEMEEVMMKFEKTQAWNLPVLDGNKYVGFVSKSTIFSAYRSVLLDFSEE